MEKYIWFYVGLMIVLIIWNSVQVGKNQNRALLNYIQIISDIMILVGFVLMLTQEKLFTNFFFISTMLLIFCFSAEVWQLAKMEKGKGLFLQTVFVLVSAIPMTLNVAILSGLI